MQYSVITIKRHKLKNCFRECNEWLLYCPDKLISNFSWSFVKHEGGGSIATIGSTQLIISSGYDEGGCVNPPIYFFDAYNTSETLGQMMTKAVNENINDIPTDYWAEYTIEEHILYGDPSLRLGGYP